MRATTAMLLIVFSSMPSTASCQDETQRYKTGQIKVRLAGQANVLASGAAAGAQPPAGANKYGTRDARTCSNTKAPAGSMIDSAHATQYFVCGAEKVLGSNLYLVENVALEVGGAARYDPRTQTGFSQMDTPIE